MKLRVIAQEPILCFDLENRPSAYWYDGQTTSEITAFGWKWSNERNVRYMLLQNDGTFVDDTGETLQDCEAYEFFVQELQNAALVFGHNIRQHDLPILNAALIRRKMPKLRPILTHDTHKDMTRRKDLSVSLENLTKLLEIGGKKMGMAQSEWEEANRLTPQGIEKAKKRVTSDVLLQIKLRNELRKLGYLRAPKIWAP